VDGRFTISEVNQSHFACGTLECPADEQYVIRIILNQYDSNAL
jgi:hypothetical protein